MIIKKTSIQYIWVFPSKIKINIIKQSWGTIEGFITNLFANCRSRVGPSTLLNTTVERSNFHISFNNRGSNWKIKLFPKPVGKIPKTSSFIATDCRQHICSSFSPRMWGKDSKETFKALSNSASANCVRDAILFSIKNYAEIRRAIFARQCVNHSCKSVNNRLSNQTERDTRIWYHKTAAIKECPQAPLSFLLSPRPRSARSARRFFFSP